MKAILVWTLTLAAAVAALQEKAHVSRPSNLYRHQVMVRPPHWLVNSAKRGYGLTYTGLDILRKTLVATSAVADWTVGKIADGAAGLVLAGVKSFAGLKAITAIVIDELLMPFAWIRHVLLRPFQFFGLTSWVIGMMARVFNDIFTATRNVILLPIRFFSTLGTASLLTFIMGTRRVVGALVRLPFINTIDFIDSVQKVIRWSS